MRGRSLSYPNSKKPVTLGPGRIEGDRGFTGIDARARGSFVPRIFSTRSKKVEDRERERERENKRKGEKVARSRRIVP